MPLELTRESAAAFGREVNCLIRSYIEAQNSIFKFSFLKALGLRQTDPAAAAAKVVPLRSRIDELLDQVRLLKLDADDPLGAFFMTMRPYLRTVDTAMGYFCALCGRMVEAKSDRHTRYWKDDYKNELNELQERERDYLKIGVELNERWKKIREQ